MNIHRYLSEKRLKLFKEEGILGISNIEKCRNHENELLRDNLEGVKSYRDENGPNTYDTDFLREFYKDSNIRIQSSDPKKKAFVKMLNGTIFSVNYQNAFLFCTSAGDIQVMKKKFSTEKYFEIIRPEKLGNHILTELNKQYRVIAYCFDTVEYVTSKNLKNLQEKHKNNIKLNLYPNETISESNMDLLKRSFNNYFQKEAAFFSDEKEYRFVYLVDGKIPIEHVNIKLHKNVIKKSVHFV
ncbi:MAG: hypothetical protein ACEQSA_02185 [Weeksellaceae bacterium]